MLSLLRALGFRAKWLVLDRYTALAEAASAGQPYQTVLDPSPGHGPPPPFRRDQTGGSPPQPR